MQKARRGALCIKGWAAATTLSHPDRLLPPIVRDSDGTLVPSTWDEALERVVLGFKDAQAKYGLDYVGIFGGGSLTNEKSYLLGKFDRVALRTPNIDYNGRFCMSSVAAASIKAFGADRGLPFPLKEIAERLKHLKHSAIFLCSVCNHTKGHAVLNSWVSSLTGYSQHQGSSGDHF